MTDIPKWLHANAVVKVVASGKPVLVTTVYDSGSVDGRTPRATRDDLIGIPAASFAPATLDDRILFELDRARIKEVKTILPEGKDETHFAITFMGRVDSFTINAINTVFDIIEPRDNTLVIAIPADWLLELVPVDPVTPALLAVAQVEAETVVAEAAAALNPAIVAKISAELTTCYCDMTGVRITKGESNSEYVVTFPTVNQIKLPAAQIKKRCQFIRVEQNKNVLVITVPSLWEVKEAIAQQVDEPEVQPEGLTEDALRFLSREVAAKNAADNTPAAEEIDPAFSARIIKELREQNERLQTRSEELKEQVDSLLDYIQGSALPTDANAVTERDEMSISNQPLTGCKQVVSIRRITDADLQKHINDGWEILHIEFVTAADLNVVFTRDQAAPAPTPSTRAAAKLIESASPVVSFTVPADTHGALHRKPVPTVTLNQQGTAPINFGDIATARATLQAMAADDEVSHGAFVTAVLQSRLPRQEKDELVARSRQTRVGGAIADAAANMPRRSAPHPFMSLGEVQR